jgi:hypothetical protein
VAKTVGSAAYEVNHDCQLVWIEQHLAD